MMRHWHIFLSLALAQIIIALYVNVPGHLTWDSGTYHLMVRTLFETGGFFIQNGYEAINSPLLAVGQTVPHGGHLVSQYPEYYTFLALPFFAVFGYQGLMVLNTVAFLATCALIWRSAPWFSCHRDAPAAAVIIYGLATFAWEFSQSSYPHLTSTFLILLACWLAWGAWLKDTDKVTTPNDWVRQGNGRYALAGFVFVVAIGVRLDSAFAGLALALPLIHGGRIRWMPALFMIAGALPALLGLAWINLIKFGTFMPFTYGRGPAGGFTASASLYIPMATLFAAALALYLIQTRPQLRLRRQHIVLLLLAAGLALLLTRFGQQLLFGLYQIIIDLRVRPDISEAALTRSPGNALVYIGNVKKSLIESAPFLAVIVLPAICGLIRGTYGRRWLLWLVPVGFIGFYGFFAWHGSVGLNMRYLNPALPFLAILASHEWLRFGRSFKRRGPVFWFGVVIAWLALAIFLLFGVNALVVQELVLLDGALFIAGLLLILQIAKYIWVKPKSLNNLISIVLLFSIIWSSAVMFSRDYLFSLRLRKHFLEVAQWSQQEMPANSVILAHTPDVTWGMVDDINGLIIANYTLGAPDEMDRLVRSYIDERPIFMITPREPTIYGEYTERITKATDLAVMLVDANDNLGVDLFRVYKTNR